MATTAFCSDMPSHLVCALRGCHLFFNRTMTQNTPPGYVKLFNHKGESWSAASDDRASTITWPEPNWDGLRWVLKQREERAANKCSAYVGNPSRLLEKHSRWLHHKTGWENAKLSSKQKVATLKNMKYILLCLHCFCSCKNPYVFFHSLNVFSIK